MMKYWLLFWLVGFGGIAHAGESRESLVRCIQSGEEAAQRGRWETARIRWERCHLQRPTYLTAWKLADAHGRLSQWDRARSYYAQLAAQPRDDWAMSADRQLHKIRVLDAMLGDLSRAADGVAHVERLVRAQEDRLRQLRAEARDAPATARTEIWWRVAVARGRLRDLRAVHGALYTVLDEMRRGFRSRMRGGNLLAMRLGDLAQARVSVALDFGRFHDLWTRHLGPGEETDAQAAYPHRLRVGVVGGSELDRGVGPGR